MRVFIVRPFGAKQGIDFDGVEKKLIEPVLSELRLPAGTTAQFVYSGNIRVDMMQELLVADLVIADISIHNANVFYELGVRHALRDRATILLRARMQEVEVPFDLRTERYLVYDANEPEASRAALRATIEATLEKRITDSPVFQLLPHIAPNDVATLIPLPRELREAVTIAKSNQDSGQLALLAREVQSASWRVQAYWLIGKALFELKAYKAALGVYHALLPERPDDPEANLRLATLYERLRDLPHSNVAIDRVRAAKVSPEQLQEALALLARNHKVSWTTSWSGEGDAQERQRNALSSPLLELSRQTYREGFVLNPRSYYAGLNALSMTAIKEQLARLQPDTWTSLLDENADPAHALKNLSRERERLAHAVAFALEASKLAAAGQEKDPWLAISEAHHMLLSGATLERLKTSYRGARQLLERGGFMVEAEVRQLTLYRDLGLFTEAIGPLLEALGSPDGEKLLPPAKPPGLVLLSTGHRIDAPGRAKPRFPQRLEPAVRAKLRETIGNLIKDQAGPVQGLAALANGSDILFHEVCAELGVRTEVMNPLPAQAFKAASVVDGGGDWVRRFDALSAKLPVRVLGDSEQPPPWFSGKEFGVFERGNLWLLESAFAVENANVALVTLWNREPSEGLGGTADLVASARERGAEVLVIEPAKLAET
jgi:tetratricopeptide (TPR) repeat protein